MIVSGIATVAIRARFIVGVVHALVRAGFVCAARNRSLVVCRHICIDWEKEVEGKKSGGMSRFKLIWVTENFDAVEWG